MGDPPAAARQPLMQQGWGLLWQGALLFALSLGTARAFDARAWLSDYAELKSAMAAGYANLDTLSQARRLDLREWDRRTTLAIEQAQSDAEAEQALHQLLKAFGDGHLRLLPAAPTPPPAAPSALPAPPGGAPALQSCTDLGYRKARMRGAAWARLDGYDALGTADDLAFPAGILTLRPGVSVGVIQIAALGEDAYLPLCEERFPQPKPCDRACAAETWRAVGLAMSAALARQVQALQERGVQALIVDVSGNGGGTEWVERAARIVAGPGLPSPRIGFVKHAHWVRRFEQRLTALDADLAREDLAEPLRALLQTARSQVVKAIELAANPCDRSGVWQGAPACTSLAAGDWFTTGLLAVRPSVELQGLRSAAALFAPPIEPVPSPGFKGKLAVLMDRRTASAAEQFAAMLKDGADAHLFGEPTLGAGCGYTGGGIATVLGHSRLRLRMPDCARLRKDGSNEVLGVVPDEALAPSRPDALREAVARWLAPGR